MANRLGEFALIIDPGNDQHAVSVETMSMLFACLEQVIETGLRVLSPAEQPTVELQLTASPELGSIKFWLIAMSALSFAADASEVTGVNLKDIVEAASRIASHRQDESAESASVNKIQADAKFVEAVARLVDAASESGYRSVRIETSDVRIELVGRNSTDLKETISRLQQRKRMLEDSLANMPPRPQFVDHVRRINPERDKTEREIYKIARALSRLRPPGNSKH